MLLPSKLPPELSTQIWFLNFPGSILLNSFPKPVTFKQFVVRGILPRKQRNQNCVLISVGSVPEGYIFLVSYCTKQELTQSTGTLLLIKHIFSNHINPSVTVPPSLFRYFNCISIQPSHSLCFYFLHQLLHFPNS